MRLPALGMIKTRALQFLLAPKLIPLRLRRRDELPPIQKLRRVLVVKLDGVGDTILLTPFLQELHSQSPKTRVTLLVRPASREVLQGSRLAQEMRPVRLGRNRLSCLLIAIRAGFGTWDRRFDVAIVPKWDTDYSDAPLIAALSRSRHILGYSEKVSRNKGRDNWHYDNYFTHTIVAPGSDHEVLKSLRFLECFGGVARSRPLRLQGQPLPAEVERAFSLNGDGRASGREVALGIGSNAPNRRWPVERFVDLAVKLVEAGYRPVLIGGKDDIARARPVVKACGAENVIELEGRLSLRGSHEALRRCACYVGNDSGPMHLAAAAGIPVVEISAFPATGHTDHSTSVTRFGPWGVDAVIVQPARPLPPCREACEAPTSHCISQVSVDEVWDATWTILTKSGSGLGTN